MDRKIGILYASVDGQTLKICKSLATYFKAHQIPTELYPIDKFESSLSSFHTLIIGASIHYGKHDKKVITFINANKAHLKHVKTAFFSVNLVARKDDKNTANTNPYLIKFLKSTHWKPDFVDVFAGKLDYKSYSFLDKLMIKLIMKLTKGPTKSDVPIEYTDWKRVELFGRKISTQIKK